MQPEGYASYLLRLRKVQGDNCATWVASVMSTATHEQRSFPNVEALATFLLAEFACRLPGEDPGRHGEAGSSPKVE